ncbi:response regulator transcription factor [Algoriphagus sp. AGSA1]|uniref:response regulator transcription factor n=1 Tax=Algoriphagus sp. AGSA1 TaxID=2907213 RepID=UPI001F48AF49|nr:response regulator transcription factor [Algoriphagus sp. AGSA1]MCE7054165.1 response regulator transcription factor [Algoriphagus sp. AGSA1]
MPIHIAIAEDNSFALQGLKRRLAKYREAIIKCTAKNGKELLSHLQKDHNIDIVLMDLQMPEMDGITATLEVKNKYPQIKVLILTTFDDEETLFNAILSGASGYLLKEDNGTEIFQAIMDTLSGGAAMSPVIALKTLQLIRQPLSKDQKQEDFGLTTREIELLTQLKNGLTYEQIAANLHISYHTVRKHIENIYRKLQVNNKVEAVRKASENRLT